MTHPPSTEGQQSRSHNHFYLHFTKEMEAEEQQHKSPPLIILGWRLGQS